MRQGALAWLAAFAQRAPLLESIMNRKQRRAGAKRDLHPVAGSAAAERDRGASLADLMSRAHWHHQQRQPEEARDLCDRVLKREPSHVGALNLLGLIHQGAGRHKMAIREFKRAVAVDDLDAACHYNLASSWQALRRESEAAAHYQKAIALGLSGRSIEDLIFSNPAVMRCFGHIGEPVPGLPAGEERPQVDLESIADDIFLQCALTMALLPTARLERFFTFLRSTMLAIAHAGALRMTAVNEGLLRLCCALAQQCFINEYVFAQSERETRQSSELREMVLQRLAGNADIPPFVLAAVAAYFPLYTLAAARVLAQRNWPQAVCALIRTQLIEPLEEAEDASRIPTLTAIAHGLSRQVMQQYAENPYPRWIMNPLLPLAATWKAPPVAAGKGTVKPIEDILIAGCGTGQHVFHVVHNFPQARVLAVDISRPSLAYARRKTREANLPNVEYAQADILELGTLGRSFDLIEAVGVLHHLADPEAGWRILLSLLRPKSEMRIGLYSEAARRGLKDIQAFISERGYPATLEDIRECRQEILRQADRRRWTVATQARDFYSVSGFRDLLFNVMEHTFTIPRIKAFLDVQRLTFLGFDLDRGAMQRFQQRFPDQGALTDLDRWDAFEADNPQTFRHMYQFMIRNV